MGMHKPLLLSLLVLAAPLTGCIVPENMQVLREELGFAALDQPVVRIRASTLTPVVRQVVDLEAVVVGGVAPFGFTWTIGEATEQGPAVQRSWTTPGTIAVRVAVTTAEGAVGSDEVEVVVGDNSAPLAVATVAGEPRVAVGETVSFVADGSSDPDGDELVYSWSFDDGTTARGAQVDHAYEVPGRHTATLVVSDGVDASNTSVVVAVDERFERAGTTTAQAPYSTAFDVAADAARVQGVVSFARSTGVEAIEVALEAPDGTRSVVGVADDVGVGTGTASFELDAPASGPWRIEVVLTRGVDAELTMSMDVLYRAD